MASDNNFLVSIDIGSSKIVVLLAEEINGRLEVFGHAKGDSAGVKKGLIVDVEQASQAIKKVAEDAYLSCNTDFLNVSVNISDPHLTVINREGQITVSGNKITEQDIESAIKIARAVPTPTNKQVISSVSNRYTLDKDPITHQGNMVEQPIGQEAKTLEVSMHIVTVSNQCVNTIDQSIRKSNLGLSNIVLNSMASSEPCITQDEKDSGVCLIDIGSGVTNLSVFTQGGITHSAVIQEGGDQITEDIAYAFDTSFEEAERLKIDYGCAQRKLIRQDKLVLFQQIDDPEDAERYLSHQSLVEVIEQSYLTLFSHITKNLKDQNLCSRTVIKSGFVLTGGATKIVGCDELLLSYSRIRTKFGRVNIDKITTKKVQFEKNLKDPVYACALGLLLFEPNEADFREKQLNKQGNFLGKIKEHLSLKL
ncbi:Cell division protein FtsA [hydrothermal vent metagenome]|uniref:Cell division protein FtsA n=1 Tax=hydrothermal vent metagenome TaxID=652676 RepID=A0A1W1DH36_9ZZZZ